MSTEPLSVGSTFETPIITELTTYWVEDRSSGNMVEALGGRSEQGDGQYHDNSIRWLIFDAAEDIVIHSVDVFADGAGEREIGVIDSDGNVVMSTTVEVADGASTVIIDLEVPAVRDMDCVHSMKILSCGVMDRAVASIIHMPWAISRRFNKAQPVETMRTITITSFTIGLYRLRLLLAPLSEFQ